MSTRAAAEDLLKLLTAGQAGGFRPGQGEAIERLVDGRGRVLVVQRTGWGKSAVYFVATRLLRDQGAGPTVLISPLLALMRNQIQMAERLGVRAATINSANRDDWETIEAQVAAGEVDVLLISPERLNNLRFRRDVLPDLVRTVGLLVVDEAHCISDWGHDFRPDYRRIARVLQQLPRGIPVLCTTATANDRVVADIVDQLGHDLEVFRGTLDRESLALSVLDLPDPARRLAWLAAAIPTFEGSGIVYCLTVSDTERVARWLRSRGIDALAYSGESETEARLEVEEALLANRVKVVVATSALGMGFDKPDLTFVVHYQSPGSPIAYYQQVGRAGRAVPRALGILLRGHEDLDIQDYFIRTAFPPRPQAEQVIGLLEDAAVPVPITAIEREVNARRTRLEAMLKVFEVEGAVERADGGWLRTLQPWTYDEARVSKVTELRRVEQAAMVSYAATDGCRMLFLRRQLDDPDGSECGRCDRCTGDSLSADLDPALVGAAVTFLRGAALEIEPRKMWPAGLESPKGKIPPDHQLQPGRALGVYGDGGWGSVVKAVKHGDGAGYPDELVEAVVTLVGKWAPPVEWLACVPSATAEGGSLSELAALVAKRLQVPLVDALQRVRPGRPQKEMENSAQQLGNVYGAFAVAAPVPDTPVLLLDDIADSRWTLTVCGAALLDAGSGPVHPLVLAKALSA